MRPIGPRSTIDQVMVLASVMLDDPLIELFWPCTLVPLPLKRNPWPLESAHIQPIPVSPQSLTMIVRNFPSRESQVVYSTYVCRWSLGMSCQPVDFIAMPSSVHSLTPPPLNVCTGCDD